MIISRHPNDHGFAECPHPIPPAGCEWRHLDGIDTLKVGMTYFIVVEATLNASSLIDENGYGVRNVSDWDQQSNVSTVHTKYIGTR